MKPSAVFLVGGHILSMQVTALLGIPALWLDQKPGCRRKHAVLFASLPAWPGGKAAPLLAWPFFVGRVGPDITRKNLKRRRASRAPARRSGEKALHNLEKARKKLRIS